MSYDLVEIAGRVQSLERENRRLKLGAGSLVAVLVAVPLVGAVLPAQVPEVIEARAFRVLDEQGTSRTFPWCRRTRRHRRAGGATRWLYYRQTGLLRRAGGGTRSPWW